MQERRIFIKHEASRLLHERGFHGTLIFSGIIIALLTVALVCVCDAAARFFGNLIPGGQTVGTEEIFAIIRIALFTLFIMPLYIGQFWISLRVCSERFYRPLPGDIFLPFANRRRLARSYRCYWSYLWRIVAAAAVIIAVYRAEIVIYKLLAGGIPDKTVLALSFLLSSIAVFVTAAAAILRFCRIFPLFALCYLYPDDRIDSLVCRAGNICRERETEIIVFFASFAGALILSVLSAGILFFVYAAPFFNAAGAVFSLYLVESEKNNPAALVKHPNHCVRMRD